jgi:hypothetical protein
MRAIFSRVKSFPDAAKFAAVLAAGLLLALGRFHWEPGSPVPLRAWTLGGFFFSLLAGGAFALGRAGGHTSRRYFWPALTGAAVLLNLPYCWLGLDRYFYLAGRPLTYGVEKHFVPEWLGHAQSPSSWNSTDTLLSGLLGGALLAAVLALRSATHRRRLAFFLLLFAGMTTETWLHLSNRSPYTYITHYEQPPAANYVSAWTMLPDGRGAVNADFAYFIRLEELFVGNSPDTPTLLVRRPFPFYLSAHLSYFLGGYHAFLVGNLLAWLAAAVSLYWFCRDISGSSAVAASAAALVACGPGFVMYAAQPMSYLPGFAILAVAVYLYHRLALTGLARPAAVVAAGILFGLTLLTYDTFAWALFWLGYAALVRASLARAALSVLIGLGVYGAFLLLVFRVFHLPAEHANDRYIGDALRQAVQVFRHPAGAQFLALATGFFGNYLTQILQVNFYVPVLVAAVGLFCARLARRPRAVALLLLAPSAAGFAVLYFGQTYLASFSRFNYTSYPGVVLLAALALGAAADSLSARGRPWAARSVVGLPILACALLANVDAFGCMPQLFFHFYYSAGGQFS